MASLAIRVVCVSLPLAALVCSLHGHADFQAFAASKITAGQSAILTLSWNLPLALPSIGSADFSKEVP